MNRCARMWPCFARDRAQTDFRLLAAEGGLDPGQAAVGPQDTLQVTFRVERAQHVRAGPGVLAGVLAIALPQHAGGQTGCLAGVVHPPRPFLLVPVALPALRKGLMMATWLGWGISVFL